MEMRNTQKIQEQEIDQKITKIIERLKKEIIFHFHPKSIILFGSFGKGEIAVIEEDGKLNFLSDCDVIVVPYKWFFSRKKVNEFEQDFYEQTGLKVDIWGATLTFCFLFPFFAKRIKPTIATYELKYASKILYGKDYLAKIPNFNPGDLPLWEGIKLLLNRMAEAMEYFSLKEPTERMVFWADKIVLACQDALLISMGAYNHSYRIRNKVFQEVFPKKFDELNKVLPNFLNLTMEATKRRLDGSKYLGDITKYWFEVREICDKVFRYIIEKDMNIRFHDYVEFQEKYIKNPKIKEYQFEILPFSIYQNIVSLLKLIRLKDIVVLFNIMSKNLNFTFWRHLIYSIIPLVYFGVSEGYEVNKKYLNKTKEILSKFERFEETTKNNFVTEFKFNYIKNKVIHLWRFAR